MWYLFNIFFVIGLARAGNETEIYEFWRKSVEVVSLYPTLPIAMPESRDHQCREDSLRLIANLRNQTTWAMQMWDSSAKSSFGILYGNKYNLGSYDECLLVREPVRAQYCNVKIKAMVHLMEAFLGDPYDIDPFPNTTVWKKFQDSRRDKSKYARDETHWGLCVPASCSRAEVERGINLYLEDLNEHRLESNGTTYRAEIPEDYCVDGSEDEFSPGEIGFWAFTLLLIVVVIATSCIDAGQVSVAEEETRAKRLLMSFSLKRNVSSLMKRDEGGDSRETNLLYGVRFYNVCYIVTDHRVTIAMSTIIFNPELVEMLFRTWQNMFLPAGDLFIDTFFFMGGLLALLNLLDLNKYKTFSPIRLIAHRYLRFPFRVEFEYISERFVAHLEAVDIISGDVCSKLAVYQRVEKGTAVNSGFRGGIVELGPRAHLREGRAKRIFMSFSLKRNIPQLLYENQSDDSWYLNFLHGVKVVTIAFIVLDHHVMFRFATAIINKQEMELALRSWQSIFIPNGDLLVDTCFFIGGVLVTHLYLEHSDKIKANPLLIVFLRLFRLAPLYFYIIWFQSSAMARFGSGPAWKFGLRDEIGYCQKNWWANVLFIQNYVTSDEMCMLHAWYLPCDFHFFIVAILVASIIKKNRVVGVVLLYFITIISIVTPGVITYMYELNPTVEFQPEFLEKPREDPTFQLLYVKSHTRISVYLLGMITAYHLFSNRNSTWKIPNIVSVLGCFLGLGLLFAPMAYGGPTYYNPRRTYDVVAASIFASVRRVLWGLAWVIFLFINRFGVIPIFGKVFTWRISVPLSKTTYAVYLIHFLLQISDQAKVRIPYQFIPFDMFVKGTNDLFFSVGYAFALYLILELPFRLVFKEIIFPSRKGKTSREKHPQRITAIPDEIPKLNGEKL